MRRDLRCPRKKPPGACKTERRRWHARQSRQRCASRGHEPTRGTLAQALGQPGHHLLELPGEDCPSWVCVEQNVERSRLGAPQGGREREVPRNERARRAPRDHPSASTLRGCPPHYSRAKAILRNGSGHPVGWHMPRHTIASHLTMRREPPRPSTHLMGHATIEMTMRYALLSPGQEAQPGK